MRFRTELPSYRDSFSIRLHNHLMFLGSCFSEHVSEYFIARKFNVLSNPFGILFNPMSIALALDFMTGKQKLSERYFDFFDDKWVSFAHHGKFSNPDCVLFSRGVSHSVLLGANFLEEADFLFITLGTSYYYCHAERGIIVANCHKFPSDTFVKQRATVSEIFNAFIPFFSWREQYRPNLKVIFTVSPVRHLGDGFHENQLSKAILHLSIEKMLETYDNLYYFPAYEIFMDDLRDYRFYDKDLCHPSPQGVEYLLEKMASVVFNDSTRQQIMEIEKEIRRNGHKPLL